MNRAHVAVAATLFSTALYTGAASAQAPPPQAPPMKQVLAGKTFTPPVRGEALVEFTQPVTKAIPGKSMVETIIKVRNASLAPIARLQVTETWYDKDGSIVNSGRGTINGLLQPGEIQTMTIDTPYNAKMSSNNWNFTHANGTVKVAKVKTLDAPKTPAGTAARQEDKSEDPETDRWRHERGREPQVPGFFRLLALSGRDHFEREFPSRPRACCRGASALRRSARRCPAESRRAGCAPRSRSRPSRPAARSSRADSSFLNNTRPSSVRTRATMSTLCGCAAGVVVDLGKDRELVVAARTCAPRPAAPAGRSSADRRAGGHHRRAAERGQRDTAQRNRLLVEVRHVEVVDDRPDVGLRRIARGDADLVASGREVDPVQHPQARLLDARLRVRLQVHRQRIVARPEDLRFRIDRHERDFDPGVGFEAQIAAEELDAEQDRGVRLRRP